MFCFLNTRMFLIKIITSSLSCSYFLVVFPCSISPENQGNLGESRSFYGKTLRDILTFSPEHCIRLVKLN